MLKRKDTTPNPICCLRSSIFRREGAIRVCAWHRKLEMLWYLFWFVSYMLNRYTEPDIHILLRS